MTKSYGKAAGSKGAMPTRKGGKRVAPDAAPGRMSRGSNGGAHAEVSAAAVSLYKNAADSTQERPVGGNSALNTR